ncbi:F-box only protein 39-like [Oncorhynchus nerka]|uniref:F-box only protein 39-like n=1 Tax=Oncorhynchus nerka TaxID=8023 RepID=UPI001130ECE1|nr:F-box only protein 39-like [Oncorhynchus nerka]
MDYPEDPEEQLSENKNEEEGEDKGIEIMDEEEGEMEEDKKPKLGWANLPDVCLRQVFWWLRDRDRVKAALVCRHWHHVMRSPSLWRVRNFNFSGRISRTRRLALETAVCYAKTYGAYLEDLEIRFSHPLNSLVARRFQQTLRTFLAALRKTGGRLRRLTVNHMALDRAAWCRSVRNSLVRSLAFYLRREGSRLGYLSLRGARLNLPQGLEVLEAVAAAQQHIHLGRRPGITHLNLEDFFSQPLAVFVSPAFPQVMNRFQGLCTLTLNYSCLSDELLAALSAACRSLGGGGSLQTFTVRCHIHEPHIQVVWGDAWSHLAQHCPDLRVQITVERILDVDKLGRILLREIPLRLLSLTSCYFSEQDWSAKPALTSLVPCYRSCLQKLSLDLNNSHESVDEELLEVVLLCSRLVYLKVWAFLDISFLDRLLQKRLEKKTILRTIKVRIYTNKYETHDEDGQLEEVYSRYRQLINSELHYLAISYPML